MRKNIKFIWALRLAKLANVSLMLLPAAYILRHAYSISLSVDAQGRDCLLALAMFAALYVMFARVYDAFLISQSHVPELAGSQILSVFFSDLFFYAIVSLMMHAIPPLLPLVISLLEQMVIAVLWCWGVHDVYNRVCPPTPTVIVYEGVASAQELSQMPGLKKRYRVQRILSTDECDAQMRCLDGCETVFLLNVANDARDRILKYCVERDLEVYVIPCVGDLIMSGAERVRLFRQPLLRVARYHPRLEYVICKRLFDIVVSFAGAVVLSPVLLITALAVWLCDRGPVFYRQTRLTRDGRTFSLLKFRSMRLDAESDGVARLSTGRNDARVTPVGRVIRKYRIDELPQLLNILRGDLSVVGPRPERPEIAEQYEQTLPEFRLRLQAKAGLTGYAQVYGKYNTDPYHKLQMDLMYIANPSFLEDLRICFVTVKALFRNDSTEGVEDGMTTAEYASAREE